MMCISCHTPLSPTLSERRYTKQCKTAKFCWVSTAWLQQDWSRVSVKTRALPSSPFITALSTAHSPPDLGVLIRTSALFLFAYWIANFVVPKMVYKDIQMDDANEKKSGPSDENLSED